MYGFGSTSQRSYAVIADQSEEESVSATAHANVRHRHRLSLLVSVPVIASLLAVVTVVTYSTYGTVSNSQTDSAGPAFEIKATCKEPELRLEWSSATSHQRKAYVDAVMYLQTIPSRLGLNHSLWEDFPYVHVWHGHDAHDGVSFFAYHRWMLHLYALALRTDCHYLGPMLYWDWSIDWEDPYGASVFDNDFGFGGDGNVDEPGFRGFCIKEGPLKGYQYPYIEYLSKPHCLSRSFMSPGEEFDRWRKNWQPDRIADLMKIDDVNDLVDEIEYKMHRALPKLIGGDFTAKSAPADPIFYLHHGQLDRIYWRWQQEDPDNRLWQYRGRKTREDTRKTAKLTDRLFYGDIGPSVIINETMDIQGTHLCYRY